MLKTAAKAAVRSTKCRSTRYGPSTALPTSEMGKMASPELIAIFHRGGAGRVSPGLANQVSMPCSSRRAISVWWWPSQCANQRARSGESCHRWNAS